MGSIVKYRVFIPITYARLECWLSNMSEKGLHLAKYGSFRYQFEVGVPQKRSYFVYHTGEFPRNGEGYFSFRLRYPNLIQSIGVSKRRSSLNQYSERENVAKVIIEVDTQHSLQEYKDITVERNRLYLIEFLRNVGIFAIMLGLIILLIMW